MTNRSQASCSFCCKSSNEVGPLAEGPKDVYICKDCAQLCQTIIEQELQRRTGPVENDSQCRRALLDRLLPREDVAKNVLWEAATYQSNRPTRILLCGPSPAAAKHLARAVAFAMDLPFAAGSAAELADKGSGNLFLKLLRVADFDIEKARKGVLFIGSAESPAVQHALIDLWRKNELSVRGLTLETRELLFVCCATISGREEADVANADASRHSAGVESLLAGGAIPEWTALLTAIAFVAPLDQDCLAPILDWVEFRKAIDRA
jgi:hypothetical protein